MKIKKVIINLIRSHLQSEEGAIQIVESSIIIPIISLLFILLLLLSYFIAISTNEFAAIRSISVQSGNSSNEAYIQKDNYVINEQGLFFKKKTYESKAEFNLPSAMRFIIDNTKINSVVTTNTNHSNPASNLRKYQTILGWIQKEKE